MLNRLIERCASGWLLFDAAGFMHKRNWTKAADKHPEGFLKGDLVSEVDLALLEAEKSFAA